MRQMRGWRRHALTLPPSMSKTVKPRNVVRRKWAGWLRCRVRLTIDDAGPALTKTVNDLLLACYGMRFTVEIQTQRALANGELREGFEILVHDADSDSSKSVGVMSGGQKVWINECLTRGIALYIAGNASQPYQSLFSDESDGPLDLQRKVQFMRMKREVLKQGGYEREFFISQTPELIAEADAVIDVAALAQ
jgi:exonuclease SbcC